MTIVGTRPELIKMSRVIAALDECFHHVLVHTGQNYDYQLNDVFFNDLGIRKPDFFLEAAGGTAIETIAKVITTADAVMAEIQPEAVLIYGDTNSGLACIPAKRRKIPIFHFEAGNRCFDARVPEEINRKIIDHTSDVNFVLTEHARRYLLAEGFAPDRILKSGSHMEEVLDYARTGIEASSILGELGLERGRYFLVSAHREENVDSEAKLRELIRSLNALSSEHDVPVVISTHPRTRIRLEAIADEPISDKVRFLKPFGFLDYIRLQLDALCVISDSGTISEEAALLKFPAVTLRDSHERPEGQDAGVVVLSDVRAQAISDAVRIAVKTQRSADRQYGRVPDYEAGQVSIMITRVLSGYIDFVNRVVWSKGY